MAHVNTNYAKVVKKYNATKVIHNALPAKPLLPPTSAIMAPLNISQNIPGNFKPLPIEAELVTEVMKLRAELRMVNNQLRFYESQYM